MQHLSDQSWVEHAAALQGLMLDTLGISWARRHLAPYRGKLLAVPDADLAGLLAQAQADDAATKAAGSMCWGFVAKAPAGAARGRSHTRVNEPAHL